MNYRVLGRTGLSVSAVSLGTVSLGLDYGIAAPGDFGRPGDAEAIGLLTEAIDRGVTLFDTAPAYGESERLIGRAIGRDPRAIIATKVQVPPGPPRAIRDAINASLDASRRAISRDMLDIVQLHNATRETVADGWAIDALEGARRGGSVRFIGASVYGEDAALAAIDSGRFDVLQIAFNALDQRMAARVLPSADDAGVGIVVRSAFLKGALTSKAQWLPEPLAQLRHAAERARDVLAGGSWERLPTAAFRFCLSAPGVASVLAGARTMAELDAALVAEAAGALDTSTLSMADNLALTDEQLLNPSYWPLP